MKKILMVIVDGLGIRNDEKGNAVKMAKMNNFWSLWDDYPHCLLKASERSIGLVKGQAGNCELGHMTIGAGRLIKKGYNQIAEAFNKNQLKTNDTFNEMINYAKTNDKPIHLMALLSEGGIHSHVTFVYSMLQQLALNDIQKVYIHAISDGKDSPNKYFREYIMELMHICNELEIGKIASVCGRYYAMDKSSNWDRTKTYYDLLTKGSGIDTHDVLETIEGMYLRGQSDLKLEPIIVDNNHLIKDGDVILWMNYRVDRSKQIINALTSQSFLNFPTYKMENLKVYSICPVGVKGVTSILKDVEIENALGVYLSQLGLSQARIAEEEKYMYVTTSFDGGKKLKLPNCEHYKIESIKVKDIPEKPEMSAIQITKTAMKCMEKDVDFILVNLANPDEAAQTKDIEATIKACQAVDICLGKLREVAEDNFYNMVVLSDHGNAELTSDISGNPLNTKTTNQVPFIITDNKLSLVNGDLTMVAPTILKYMDIAIPKEMRESETLFLDDEN